jgi:branched-chain amino acid transport system ATP-binding protein
VDQKDFNKDNLLLNVQRLTKKFGGLIAVNDVNLKIKKGIVYSIIGPNGAGKTTFFNLIYGVFTPSAGKIYFQGQDITKRRSNNISHLGIGRSFQGYNLFTHLSVLENIRIASQSREKYNFNFFSDVMKYEKPIRKSQEVLEKIGIIDLKDRYPYELSHGDQRLLEIGIVLATNPILLMLDEPTSGLAPEETEKMIKLLESIKKDYTILLIEHKMMVVMSVSEQIIVMHQGSVIAEGTPEEIRDNEKVHEAYLGGYKQSDLRN